MSRNCNGEVAGEMERPCQVGAANSLCFELGDILIAVVLLIVLGVHHK